MKNDPIANAYLTMLTEDADAEFNSGKVLEEAKKIAKSKPAKGATKPVEDKKHSDSGTTKKAKSFIKGESATNPFDDLYNKFLKEDGLSFASFDDANNDASSDEDSDEVTFDDEDNSDLEGDDENEENSDEVSFTLPSDVARQLYDVLGGILGGQDEDEDSLDELEDENDELEDENDELEDDSSEDNFDKGIGHEKIKQESIENKPQKFNTKYKNPGVKYDKKAFKQNAGKAKITSGEKPTGGWVQHKPTAVKKLTKGQNVNVSMKTGKDLFSQ